MHEKKENRNKVKGTLTVKKFVVKEVPLVQRDSDTMQ